jgi:vesicle coat complex subunit
VRSIGRLAIKVEPAADGCIKTLLGLIETKVSYVVPEAIIVIKDIFRRYPGKYEGIIPTLCEHLDALEEPEAKAAMIWIVGQFADKIDNADELLEDLLYTFKEDPVEVCGRDISVHDGLKHPGYLGSTCAANRCGEALHLQVSIRCDKRACS